MVDAIIASPVPLDAGASAALAAPLLSFPLAFVRLAVLLFCFTGRSGDVSQAGISLSAHVGKI